MVATQRPGNRKIYLVQPKFPPSYWGMDEFLPLTPYRAVFPPLGLLTLAGLTPPEFSVTICDENIGEKVDYDTDAQIIGITGYIIQLHAMLDIADAFRARGKTVVIGGPAANLLPEWFRPHCDVLFQGEAEYTWPRFLKEYAEGTASDLYQETEKIHMPDSKPPRIEVAKNKYANGIVQCTRGCPFSCEFCDIIVMYGRKMRFKPVEQVIQECKAWHDRGASHLFFADDNFIGHRAYAKELLTEIVKWSKTLRYPLSFHTQASIDMVRDEELLGLMRDANFITVFIGIETPRKASLAETHKIQNEKLDLVEAIHKIQSFNLFIYCGMIVGFDQDDVTIFDEQYEFLQKAQIPVVMLSVLLAVPKTPLYERLEKAGRIHNDQHASTYVGTAGGTNFRPLNMTEEELKVGQQVLYRRLYAPEAYEARLLGNLGRFNNVNYRGEALQLAKMATLARLIVYYCRKGKAARRFFFRIVLRTLRHSPKSLRQVITLLGMYKHFCEVHKGTDHWDPWAKPKELPKPIAAPTTQPAIATSA